MKRTGFAKPTPKQLERNRQWQRKGGPKRKANFSTRGKVDPEPLKRRKRLPPVNHERRARLFVRNYHSEAFVGWIHSLACSVSSKEGSEWDPVVAAHVRAKGAGGDWTMVIPMLQSLHDECHRIGIRTFQKKYGVDLELIAAAVQQRWKAFAGEELEASDE